MHSALPDLHLFSISALLNARSYTTIQMLQNKPTSKYVKMSPYEYRHRREKKEQIKGIQNIFTPHLNHCQEDEKWGVNSIPNESRV